MPMMPRVRGGDDAEKDKPAGLLRMAHFLSFLMVFIAGLFIGLTTSSLMNNTHVVISRPEQYTLIPILHQPNNCTFKHKLPDPPDNNNNNRVVVDCMNMDTFLHPTNLTHALSDDHLFWRASLVPKKQKYPYKRTPKLAFMFLTRGPLPMLPLWERFFLGHDNLFNIYIHAPPPYILHVPNTSSFYGRQIPSQDVSWGTVTLVDAERRLLANALLDFSNERFILVSESCIPVYNFPTVYRYLIESNESFVESYDDPSRYGRGRYNRRMLPDIHLRHWRKGSQWFELNRALAVHIVSDTYYYSLFRKYCKPACYPDEHYIPTYLNMFHGSLNSNRTVTWVDWSIGGPHPATYGGDNITVTFLQAIRNNGTLCQYNSDITSICYLFARKFHPSALEPLLNLSSIVMDF